MLAFIIGAAVLGAVGGALKGYLEEVTKMDSDPWDIGNNINRILNCPDMMKRVVKRAVEGALIRAAIAVVTVAATTNPATILPMLADGALSYMFDRASGVPDEEARRNALFNVAAGGALDALMTGARGVNIAGDFGRSRSVGYSDGLCTAGTKRAT